MSFHRIPSFPFIPADNQWTQGLVFFAILDGTGDLKNLIRPAVGTASSPGTMENVYSIDGYPGLHFDATNGERIDWDQDAMFPLPSVAGGSVTVVARVNPTSGANDAGSFLGTFRLTPTNGFMLYFDDVASPDNGLTFIVAEGGSTLFSTTGTSANYSGYEYTAAGRYDNTTRTTSVWQNGIKLDEDTDAGTAWLTTPTTFLRSGDIPNSVNHYTGNIYWVACFDRALTDAEMVVWQTQDPLDLILPDEPLLITAGALPYTLSNEVLVGDAFSGQSPYFLSLDLVAGAVLSGDMSSVPPVPPVFALANEVLVLNSLVAVATELIVLGNVVTVTNAMGSFSTFALANEVMVGSSFQSTVGNQIVGDRYRR